MTDAHGVPGALMQLPLGAAERVIFAQSVGDRALILTTSRFFLAGDGPAPVWGPLPPAPAGSHVAVTGAPGEVPWMLSDASLYALEAPPATQSPGTSGFDRRRLFRALHERQGFLEVDPVASGWLPRMELGLSGRKARPLDGKGRTGRGFSDEREISVAMRLSWNLDRLVFGRERADAENLRALVVRERRWARQRLLALLHTLEVLCRSGGDPLAIEEAGAHLLVWTGLRLTCRGIEGPEELR
jgi:hypothetical protein